MCTSRASCSNTRLSWALVLRSGQVRSGQVRVFNVYIQNKHTFVVGASSQARSGQVRSGQSV